MRNGGLLSVGAIVLPKVPVTSLDEQSEADPEAALNFFDTLALTQERRGHVRHTWVRKWGWPVTIRLHGNISDDVRDDLASAVDELRTLTGHEIVVEGDGVKRVGTIDIYVSPYEEIADRMPTPGGVCNTHSRGARGALFFARIDISDGYTDCLRHELMHAMGFANHWKRPAGDMSMPSVLAMRSAPHRVWDYSDWDKLALQILYHPDIQPGLPRGVALQRAEALLRQALEQDRLRGAPSET